MRNVPASGDTHISQKYEFGGLAAFPTKVLGDYTHFLGFGYRLGAATGVELCKEI